MRKLFKKSMALVLTSAMAITGAVSFAPESAKTVKAADEPAVYNAYTVFQTDQIWAFRNQWTDGTSGGLDGGKGKGEDYSLKFGTGSDAVKITYNYLKNWAISGGTGAGGKEIDPQVIDGDIKDAKMDHEGDYEISINNLPLADKVSDNADTKEKWSMLVISTDVPFTNTTVKCTNAKVYFDDETTPFAELADVPRNTEKSTCYGASNFEIFSSYGTEHGTAGKVLDNTKAEYMRFPKKSMRITFHLSGVNFNAPKEEITVENGLAENATFTDGDFVYKIITRSKTDGTKGTVVISGVSAAAAKKTSLSTVAVATNGTNKYDVTGIGSKAFQGNKALKKITLGSTITSISSSAFSKCTKLSTISFGKNVKTIGGSAFEGCTSLKKVKLGSAVTSVGSSAFKKCTKLTSITYNKKVTSVAASTFEGCASLSKITLGSKVKSIKKSAFKGCKKLAKVAISQKVKVTKGAFKGCKKTIKVSGKKANTKYTVQQIKKSGYKKVK